MKIKWYVGQLPVSPDIDKLHTFKALEVAGLIDKDSAETLHSTAKVRIGTVCYSSSKRLP